MTREPMLAAEGTAYRRGEIMNARIGLEKNKGLRGIKLDNIQYNGLYNCINSII